MIPILSTFTPSANASTKKKKIQVYSMETTPPFHSSPSTLHLPPIPLHLHLLTPFLSKPSTDPGSDMPNLHMLPHHLHPLKLATKVIVIQIPILNLIRHLPLPLPRLLGVLQLETVLVHREAHRL